MIADFERYHGVALRSLIVAAQCQLTIEKWGEEGRVDSYLLNSKTGVHIKHSAKRLPPWQFSFTDDQLQGLSELRTGSDALWFIFVCGQDGVVALADAELAEA